MCMLNDTCDGYITVGNLPENLGQMLFFPPEVLNIHTVFDLITTMCA